MNSRIVDKLPVTGFKVEIGYAFSLCAPAHSGFPDLQLGYSMSPDGMDLCGESAGQWRRSWFVIATDGQGDPLFVDSARTEFPILTAGHGMGAWEPTPVSTTLAHFLRCVQVITEYQTTFDNLCKAQDGRGLVQSVKDLRTRLAGIDRFKRCSFWALCLSALRETALELREDYRPLSTKEQSVKAARDFVQEHLYPAIRTDPAFAEVYAGAHVGGKGLIVAGSVQNDAILKRLRESVESISPPMPVAWRVNIGGGAP
jgi:hypothetical protein